MESISKLYCNRRAGVLISSLVGLSGIARNASLGVYSVEETLERMKNNELRVYFRERGDIKGFELCIEREGERNIRYGTRFRCNGVSWEKVETDIREEVDLLQELGFMINYRGHVERL